MISVDAGLLIFHQSSLQFHLLGHGVACRPGFGVSLSSLSEEGLTFFSSGGGNLDLHSQGSSWGVDMHFGIPISGGTSLIQLHFFVVLVKVFPSIVGTAPEC